MCACRLHLSCGRYEIKDISPPAGITAAMALQAEAERRKRASVLESEGARQAAINIAEGNKQQVVLAAEAEAEAILRRSEATATGLRSVAAALEGAGGAAAQLRVAEAYVDAFRQLAKEGNTLLLPASLDSPAAMVAQAMSVYNRVTAGGSSGSAAGPSGGSGGLAAGGSKGSAAPKTASTSSSSSAATRPGSAPAMAAASPGSGAMGPPVFTLRSV